MSAEISAVMYEKINSIIALDPADDFPGSFDTNNVNFSTHSEHSWAFLSSWYGSEKSVITADASFIVNISGDIWGGRNNLPDLIHLGVTGRPLGNERPI